MVRFRRILPVLILIAALLPLAALQSPATAATFTVTRTDDPAPGGCSTSDCSLREAISAANNHAGPDTVKLGASAYFIEIAGDDNANQEGDLDIKGPLKIVGAGKTQTFIDGNDLDRVIHIIAPATVTFSGLTIENGLASGAGGGILNGASLTLKNVSVRDNDTSSSGGGISNRGTLTLVNSRVSDNTLVDSCCGGGIQNRKNLTITNSRIDNNVATSCCGGGIYNTDGGDMVIKGSRIDHNHAPECCGGGIFNEDEGATANISNTSITDNTTAQCCGAGVLNQGGSSMTLRRSKVMNNSTLPDCCGGGILNQSGSILKLFDTTVQGNDGGNFAGGIGNQSGSIATIVRSTIFGNMAVTGSGVGGGIADQDSEMTVINSTISGNSASEGGGGIYTSSGDFDLKHVTIFDNDGGTAGGGIYSSSAIFSFIGTIVGGNTPNDCGPSTLAGGLNLDSDSTCFTGGNAIHANPMLPAIGNNGGPTKTHKPQAASQAVDAVPNGDCPPPATDQRKVKRPRDGDGNGSKKCDLGSVER